MRRCDFSAEGEAALLRLLAAPDAVTIEAAPEGMCLTPGRTRGAHGQHPFTVSIAFRLDARSATRISVSAATIAGRRKRRFNAYSGYHSASALVVRRIPAEALLAAARP